MSENANSNNASNTSKTHSMAHTFEQAVVTFTHNGREVHMRAKEHAEFQHENHFGCPIAATNLVEKYGF